MKKSLLLGITGVTLLALTATTLYAQTATGTSLVDKMKAAVHTFTLAADLNAGQTGYESAPVSGKKTGNILTAGEWNRVLELLGQGGGGGSDWVDVPLTDTNPFDQQCMYRFVMQGQTYYAETVHEDRLYWINVMYFAKGNKSVLVGGIAPFTVATKIEKLCGGAGSSTGGGVEIVSGGIIENTGTVTEHTLSGNWNLITLEGAWKSGDAAPSGGYIYKLGGQKKMSISVATGVAKDTVLTNDYQCAQDFCVKLSGENVIIKPGISTVAYLMWKFGGGSASTTNDGPGSACGADGYGMVMYQSAEYSPRKKQCCYIGNGGAISGGYHDGLVRHLSCTDL